MSLNLKLKCQDINKICQGLNEENRRIEYTARNSNYKVFKIKKMNQIEKENELNLEKILSERIKNSANFQNSKIENHHSKEKNNGRIENSPKNHQKIFKIIRKLTNCDMSTDSDEIRFHNQTTHRKYFKI